MLIEIFSHTTPLLVIVLSLIAIYFGIIYTDSQHQSKSKP